MKHVLSLVASGALIAIPAAARAQAVAFSDQLVQAPDIASPSRGSLGGQYASVAFAPGDLARGTYTLPLPIALPSDRGAIGASPIPSYSVDSAISEWGAGWSASALAIVRSRVLGDVDYVSDERTGPWGRMVRGTDGAWYPDGLSSLVRVVDDGADLVAYLADGSVWTFGASVGTTTSKGTYSWGLQSVVSVLGRTTTFSYTRNASGRPFLASVTYGGTSPAQPQYELTFDYATLAVPLADYRSGQAVLLDRRVQAVHTKELSGGAFVERHTWALGYAQDGTSPAFYLASVQQTFAASGQVAPPATYTYTFAGAYLGQLAIQSVAKADPAVQTYGIGAFLPNMSTAIDVDLDGRPDFELQYDNRILQQTDTGYAAVTLPPATSSTNPVCRLAPNALNPARTLARMAAGSTDVHVVALAPNGMTHTQMVLCDRPGNTLWQATLAGNWQLGPNTRLADLNRDHLPDLVRVFPGGYQAIANESTGAAFGMGQVVQGALSPLVQMNASWVHDLNGDGIPDLLARYSGGIVAWMGKGNLQFDPVGKVLPIFSSKGLPVGNLAGYALTFVDANNDGITDLLLSNGSAMILFANNGSAFIQVNVPLFSATSWLQVQPTPLDVAGNGNTEIAYTQKGQAYAVDLDGPGVGLLASASDGRGTTVQFTYQRALPEVGVRYRNSLLSNVSVTSTGYGTVSYQYSFSKPDLHSVGLTLLGYESVTRAGALDTSTVSFLNTDDSPGTLLSETDQDALTPAVARVRARTYDGVTVRGVPWQRPKSDAKGWSSAAGTLLDTTTFGSYESDVCPTVTTESTSAGTLTTTKTLTTPAAFANALACLEDGALVTGAHLDPTLNFTHQLSLLRNDSGQVTGVTLLDRAGGALPEQAITYTPDGLVASIITAGHGTTQYAYVAGTELLAQVTTPDGVAKSVTARDPLSDLVGAVATNRGALNLLRQYTYDGRERLATSLDNLGQASAATPNARYTYKDPTSTLPGFVETDSLVDALSATYESKAALVTAGDEALASVRKIPQGWAFDALTGRVPSQRQSTAYTHPAFSGDVSALDLPTLLAGGQPVTTTQSTLWGDTASLSERLSPTVTRNVASTLALSSVLTRTDVENGALVTSTALDDKRLPVNDTNQAGAITAYLHDALGRIRGVTLADGTTRRTTLDDFGRVASVAHSDVGTVVYAYSPTTGLLQSKTFSPPSGGAARQVRYGYDGIGRTIAEVDTDLASTQTQTLQWLYDGATPSSPSSAGTALGLVTGVTGPSYARATTYRADGSVAATAVTIAGQRTITTSNTFFEDGSTRAQTTSVADASGNVLVSSSEGVTRDAYGRVSGTTLDGNALAAYAYDVNGLPLWATYAPPTGGDQVVTLSRDPLTYAQTGMNQNAGTWTAAYDRVLNVRGLIDHEDFAFAGATSTRQYGYAAPPFLQSAADPTSSYAYTYGVTGLPTSVTSTLGGVTDARVFQRSGSQLVAGTHRETFDALGRAVTVDSVSLTYGPNGQIASASNGGSDWSYVYDEAGHRVAKLEAGAVVAAFLPDGSTVDPTGRTEPVKFGGSIVGTLRHPFGGQPKTFTLVAVDARGTSLSDAQGASRPVSPFGDRAVHPDVAPTLDYAASRFDADLGLVRMGVRDYDAHLSRFTTPDPLFLEHVERCLGDATDCTLYAYARNNPLALVDPSGQDPILSALGITHSTGVNATAGIGAPFFGGIVVTGEVGIVHFPDGSFQFYATGGITAGAWGLGNPAIAGETASVGVSGTLIRDPSQFAQAGKVSEGTAIMGGIGPIQGNVQTGSNGINALSVGASVGPGALAAVVPTFTIASPIYNPASLLLPAPTPTVDVNAGEPTPLLPATDPVTTAPEPLVTVEPPPNGGMCSNADVSSVDPTSQSGGQSLAPWASGGGSSETPVDESP